jgi:hypothetical protein
MTSAHWHYATYRVINYPPDVTIGFSGPFDSHARAKVAIKRFIKDTLFTDATAMSMIDFPEREILAVLGEWMSLPQEGYYHLWPWCWEVYACSGDCARSAFDNATAMTAYFREGKVIDADVVGSPEEFAVIAYPPDSLEPDGGPERRIHARQGVPEWTDPMDGIPAGTRRGYVGNVWRQDDRPDEGQMGEGPVRP